MKIHLIVLIYCAFFLLLSPEAGLSQSEDNNLLIGETWKEQGLGIIIPAWLEHGIDPEDGQFHAFMDREWNPYNKSLKYPGMISRHLFSFSAAYMLSGDHRYLEEANRLFNYLVRYGWDNEKGGWYYAIDTNGNLSSPEKDLFMNIYAVTGLALFYMVTHHKEAMHYITETRSLLRSHAWDKTNGGYYRRLEQEWQVTDSTKAFTPQVAPISGYLFYLYAATEDQDYLVESKQLVTLVYDYLYDRETGWIREKFTADWQAIPGNKEKEQINVGHNIEVSWMLFKLLAITGDHTYRKRAAELYKKLNRVALQPNGAWIHKLALTDPGKFPETTNWWIQAYGNMMQLSAYRYQKNPASLKAFKKGSQFWNNSFVDEKYGGTILSATLDGDIERGDKAVRTKTSYHSMELALLNYLYLNLWVNKDPVTLFFRFDATSDNKPLCPLPIFDSGTSITEVIINGEARSNRKDKSESCIEVTGEDEKSIKIKIK